MFWSEMLEIAIGIIFTYLLLRPICSAVNELIERQLKNRGYRCPKVLRSVPVIGQLTSPKVKNAFTAMPRSVG